MKKLDRSLANTPTCLNNLSYPTHNWDNMRNKGKNETTSRKSQVWVELDKMQNGLCVYCESIAYKGKFTGHIEHFFDKANPLYEHRVLDWNNLFGCCVSTTHCGHYKDQILSSINGVQVKRKYDSNLLLKPDVDDPTEYLQYLPSGKIKPKNGLSEHCQNRAKETIKALNLSSSELNSAREAQILFFKKRENEMIEEIFNETDENNRDRIIVEYKKLKKQSELSPFRTAIRQTIQWLSI
ncbi:retron Ec78 anti-phage system effector HNH endonuclease PtuB [Vibrio vulnificus]|uniref:retron Ec78 anti-phage system effector HNH endonuclease PtuB n=1 Tax=Vibrio vulnificus TaxID=672 RepID=UPI003EDA8B0B